MLTAVNTLFDASSVGFLPFDLLHKAEPSAFSRRHWFAALAGLAVVIYITLGGGLPSQ